MIRLLRAALAGGMLLVMVGLCRADIVYYMNRATKKEDDFRGTIQEENPGGIKIKLKGAKGDVKEVAAKDIVRVTYESPDVPAATFRAPFVKESKARGETRPKQRETALIDAMDAFQKLEAILKGSPNARRYIQYKVAEMAVLQAQDFDEEGTAPGLSESQSVRSPWQQGKGARADWAPSSAWNTEAGGGNPTAKDHAAVSARSTASRSRSMTMR